MYNISHKLRIYVCQKIARVFLCVNVDSELFACRYYYGLSVVADVTAHAIRMYALNFAMQ